MKNYYLKSRCGKGFIVRSEAGVKMYLKCGCVRITSKEYNRLEKYTNENIT